jgi:galactitol-specific phosphotransferase system IIC component
MLAAALPVVFFILAALDVMRMEAAFDAAVWTGVGVVGFYAFVANRVAGSPVAQSIIAGAGFALLGGILVLLKAAVH